MPEWSPDGSQIVFHSDRDGDFEIFVMDAVDTNTDGEGDNMVQLTSSPGGDSTPSWAGGQYAPSGAVPLIPNACV